MDKQVILYKVTKCLSRVFEMSESEISLHSSSNTIAKWDSLGHLKLIMEIESEFGITFSTEDIPTIMDVDMICETIKEYI